MIDTFKTKQFSVSKKSHHAKFYKIKGNWGDSILIPPLFVNLGLCVNIHIYPFICYMYFIWLSRPWITTGFILYILYIRIHCVSKLHLNAYRAFLASFSSAVSVGRVLWAHMHLLSHTWCGSNEHQTVEETLSAITNTL